LTLSRGIEWAASLFTPRRPVFSILGYRSDDLIGREICSLVHVQDRRAKQITFFARVDGPCILRSILRRRAVSVAADRGDRKSIQQISRPIRSSLR